MTETADSKPENSQNVRYRISSVLKGKAFGLVGTGTNSGTIVCVVHLGKDKPTPSLAEKLRKFEGVVFALIEEDDGTFINHPKLIRPAKPLSIAAIENELNALMLGERPALSARVHCIVPMQVRENSECNYNQVRRALVASESKENIPLETENSGRTYFLPHVHGLLIPKAVTTDANDSSLDEQVITTIWQNDINPPTLKICRKWPDREIPLCLESIRLHLYTERTLALEYTLALSALEAKHRLTPGSALWSDIVLSGPDGWQRTGAAWLDAVSAARTLFSAFKADTKSEADRPFSYTLHGLTNEKAELAGWSGDDVAGKANLPIKGIVDSVLRHMLAPAGMTLPDNLTDWFELRCDDRARIVQSLTLSGQKPEAGDANDMLPLFEARLAMVDEFGTDYFYEKGFSNAETERVCYDRFSDSRYFAHDHAFTHLGFGWFANHVVSKEHVPTLYRRMALLLHLNGAVLQGMLREMGDVLKGWDAVRGGDDALTDRIGQLKRRYLKFLNLNWFEEVSSQVQGREMFDLMRATAPASREIKLVDEGITRTNAYLSNRREVRREVQDRFVTSLITIVALLAGLPTVFKGELWPSVAASVDRLMGQGVAKGWSGEIAALVAIWVVAALIAMRLLHTPIRSTGTRGWPKLLVPLGLASVLPFVPLVTGWTSPSVMLPCAGLAMSIAAMTYSFRWAWRSTYCGARSDDFLYRPLGWFYGALLGLFMLITGARAAGLL